MTAEPADFATISYVVDGAVATITLRRPEAANALNAAMIDEIDAAFDLAEADDDVRVVVLGAEGKHFCAGHDLKELFEGNRAMGRDARHRRGEACTTSRSCTSTAACASGTSPSRPSPRCTESARRPASCSPAMCDLIVAADDARFSNPVLRMSGVGVELLVEPWELGPRKAKEFLLCAETLTAEQAERFGLVNRVVPNVPTSTTRPARWPTRSRSSRRSRRGRSRTRSTHTVDRMGQRDSWRYHFMVHQFVSNTDEAKTVALQERAERRHGRT